MLQLITAPGRVRRWDRHARPADRSTGDRPRAVPGPRPAPTRGWRTGLVAGALALVGGGRVEAATLTVSLTDAAGKPLADAVALLEPATGRAVVKPMADVDIAQARRQFAPRLTLITTGTRVNFPNLDTVRHHVYSFSATKTFELKLYAGVPGAPVVFDKPGIAVIGCNIHDAMAAWIVVADTPWAARTAAAGSARIENVPAGGYRLRLWHPGFAADAEPTTAPVVLGTTDLEHRAQLTVRTDP